jgi:hypothetical protein
LTDIAAGRRRRTIADADHDRGDKQHRPPGAEAGQDPEAGDDGAELQHADRAEIAQQQRATGQEPHRAAGRQPRQQTDPLGGYARRGGQFRTDDGKDPAEERGHGLHAHRDRERRHPGRNRTCHAGSPAAVTHRRHPRSKP